MPTTMPTATDGQATTTLILHLLLMAAAVVLEGGEGSVVQSKTTSSSSSEAQREESGESDGSVFSCPFGIYGPQDSECICLSSGLWGIAEDYCSVPLALHAVKPNHTFCILNNFNHPVRHLQKLLSFDAGEPEVAQMSTTLHRIVDRFDASTTTVPMDEDIYYNYSILISHGAPMWKLTTPEDVSYCLVHRGDPDSEWCLFDQLTRTDPSTGLSTFIPIRDLSPSTNCNEPPQRSDGDAEEESTSSSIGGGGLIFSSGCNPLKGNSPCIPPDSPPLGPFSDEDIYFFEDEITTTTKRPSSSSSSSADLIARLLNPELVSSSSLLELNSNSLVVKRNDPSDKISHTGNEDLLEEDEDKISSAKTEIGHKLMRDQIDGYVDTVVAQLTGLGPNALLNKNHSANNADAVSQTSGLPNIPILKILNIIKLIMQRTCTAVKGDYFELAMNSFLKVQFESFHAKEPFLSHATYLRMAYALKLCYNKARPHVFGTSSKSKSSKCKTLKQSTTTTSILDVHGNGKEMVHLNATPPFASGLTGTGGTREPLVETVWKMLVNAHSYCYPYFKSYFNDHHALTVALLPLFSNQIQDIWLKDGGYDNNEGQKLYGGLLGDTVSIVTDVDNCVSASRFLSQYPWYMSRPLRDNNNIWRKKRDVAYNEQDNQQQQPVYIDHGKQLCLYDPDDPVAFLGKPVCE